MRQLRAAARLWTVAPRTAGMSRVATTAPILDRVPRTLAGSAPRTAIPRLARGFATSSPAAASPKASKDKEPVKKIDMSQFPPERIR